MTRRQGLRLHHRIIIPFAIVAFASIAATAYVAWSVSARALQARVRTQIVNTANLVSQSDFALNPLILRSVKGIAGADVVTYTADGTVLATTLDASEAPTLARVTAPEATRRALSAGDAPPLVLENVCVAPCYVAYRRLPLRADTVVAVVAVTTDLTAATRALTRTIVIAAILSLLVMMVVSQLVVRQVSAPLDALLRFTHEVSVDVHRRAPAGDDEIGHLGRAFNEMLDRLERSQDALVRSEKLGLAGLIAARIAHDIRNPLSSIKMQTQLLQARVADREDQAMVAAMLHDIATVEAVIRDLLELARPGALKLQAASLNDVVSEALQQTAPQLTYRKIRVATDLAPGLPAVALDAERFKQALRNVIANAADAMVTGGTLEVSTRRLDASTLAIDLCDDGVGIDPAIIDHVFDPFVSTKRDGVGLGLVNTKAVVESHGGAIQLARRAGGGTRATISLRVDEGAHG